MVRSTKDFFFFFFEKKIYGVRRVAYSRRFPISLSTSDIQNTYKLCFPNIPLGKSNTGYSAIFVFDGISCTIFDRKSTHQFRSIIGQVKYRRSSEIEKKQFFD